MGNAQLSKDHKHLRKVMQKDGFVWQDETGNGHGKIRINCPNNESFLWTIPCTPSDHRSWINQTTELRRLLSRHGYPDMRKTLRVATSSGQTAGADEIYDFLDSSLKLIS